MADDFQLTAEPRDLLGSANSRRLRLDGRIPANLYGFQKDSMNLSVSADDVDRLIAGGSRVVDVTVNGTTDKAVVQELQWDVFGSVVKHVDLMRVNPDEEVTVEVKTEIRGEAIGLKDGGQMREHVTRIELKCQSFRIPRSIPVRVGALKIGDSLSIKDLTFPETVEVLTPADTRVVEVFDPKKSAVESE